MAQAKLSSCVVLLRETKTSFEVLMLKRRQGMSFGKAFVFPGGVLEPLDTSFEWLEILGCAPEFLPSNHYSCSVELTSLKITAIRETWEETGIWLGNGQFRFKDNFLESCKKGTVPSVEKLNYFARIITPLSLPKRFDTTFFTSVVDRSNQVFLNSQESEVFMWSHPSEILNLFSNKEVVLMPPQVYILHLLNKHQSLTSLMEANPHRTPLLFQLQQEIAILPGDHRHQFTLPEVKSLKLEHFLSFKPSKIGVYCSPALDL